MKKFYIINIVCITLIYVIMIAFMTFAPRTYGFIDGENREVVKFPRFSVEGYFNGDYTETIADWYTDSIPYKYKFKTIKNSIKSYFGIESDVLGSNLQEGAHDSRPEGDIPYSLDEWVDDDYPENNTSMPNDIFGD